MMSYFEHKLRRCGPVKMRRSRPYKKNDQCYVEQKNNTHVTLKLEIKYRWLC